MPAAKTKVKRRHRHCPICKDDVAMSVMREADGDGDLWWLLCPECNNRFALTSQEYRKRKHSEMFAVERSNAKVYSTKKVYSVGELIYHPKMDDIGLVLGKASLPSISCSGSISVSFLEGGHKMLIEGYSAA